jgi:hypothetical protein
LEDRHPLKGFDAAKIIWDFFKQQPDTPGVGEGGP